MGIHLTWVYLHSGVVGLCGSRFHYGGCLILVYLNSGVVGVCYTRVNWRGGGISDLTLSAFWCSRAM